MKKLLTCLLSTVFAVFLFSGSALAQENSKEELTKELKALKERMRSLEEALEISEKGEASDITEDEDVEDLEEYIQRIEFSGTIEVEAVYEQIKPKVGKKEDHSDLTLATVDFAIDALINDRMKTHVLFEYEDDEDVEEDLIVDEAIILFQAEEVCVPDLSCNSPWYASVGKLTVPFGYFESNFISGPLTEDLGETKETAVIAGIYNPFINIAAGVFNGDTDKAGNSNRIESYVAACTFTLPEDVSPNVGLMIGVSYISNIADSDELADFFIEEFDPDPIAITDYVAGFSSFLSISFMNRLFIEAEYVGAVESFEEDKNFEPKAWNFEVAFIPIEDFEVIVRYGGSSDTLPVTLLPDTENFLPDKQVGICGIYEIFNNTSISLEYLHEEFENDDEVVTITTQLAVEF